MDTDARWSRIKQMFRDAQALPEGERDAWLATQCADDDGLLAEVRALLATRPGPSDILDDGAIGVLQRLRGDGPAGALVGQRIGVYRLLRLVGEGGMGSVFLAEREDADFSQRVALKLVRTDIVGDAARGGFLRERNLLARLVHPHVAQLHDGGVAPDGTPYFTLEYVEGEPITHYSDEHRLDLRARVRLALQVCSAVEYAHRNLVVHRDLKPSNILVTTEGEVKLLDFGIAKLIDADPLDRRTLTQSRMMTPQYAAPEQVLGDAITTATDVYAIGVLVYELCSGHLPYRRAESGVVGWSKAVVEDAPDALYRTLDRGADVGDAASAIADARSTSTTALRRSLRGDLDRIVQRALAKEPESRYPSVAALAADLEAFVDGNAISGSSRRYRMRMFVRRHWLPLAAASAVLLTLLVSTAAIAWQAREKEHAAQSALAVRNFLYGLFTAVDPREAKGREVTARELVDRGAERIERDRGLDPDQKAEIEGTLGRLYYQLGAFDRAKVLQESAEKALADDPAHALLLARTEAEHAETLEGLGDLKSAEPLAADANKRMTALAQASPEDRARTLHAQIRVALGQRNFELAQRYAGEELALVRSGSGDRDALYHALSASGAASWGLSQSHEAETYYREALDVVSRDAGPDDLDVASARANLAMSLQEQSRFPEAQQLELQALATNEKILGPDHPLTMSARRDVGLAYYHLGEYAKARTAFEQVLVAQRAKLGNEHPAIAGTDINLGLTLTDAGDLDGAERVSLQALQIFEKKYGREFQGARVALGNLGVIHMLRGDYDRAAAELGEVQDREKQGNTGQIDNFLTASRLGELERRRGHAAAAVEMQRSALAAARAEHAENTRFVALVHHWLGLALRDAGDSAGAEVEFRAALASFAGYIPQAVHPLAANARFELGQLLIARDAGRDEGILLLEETVTERERFLGADDARTQAARDALLKARSLVRTAQGHAAG
jgi:serine/threonine-protein kinase